jgi:GNAT superfamily N-acetyltransferase
VYVLDDAVDAPPVPGLTVGPARDAAEFLSVYGADLAPLVTPRHLRSPGYRFLVGRMDGVPVACAQVRRAADTAYVSAVTVRPEYRRRGIGAAVSAAATRIARDLTDGPVWLHAEDGPARVYRRLGYVPVDRHVLLTAR